MFPPSPQSTRHWCEASAGGASTHPRIHHVGRRRAQSRPVVKDLTGHMASSSLALFEDACDMGSDVSDVLTRSNDVHADLVFFSCL